MQAFRPLPVRQLATIRPQRVRVLRLVQVPQPVPRLPMQPQGQRREHWLPIHLQRVRALL